MKALIVSLMFPVLLKSCEGIPDQTGTPPAPITRTQDQGNGGNNSSNGTSDAPIDGGLTVLLAAGAAYGVKRYRDARKKKTD